MKTTVEIPEVLKDGLRKLKLFVCLQIDTDETYEFRFHPTFPTACWRWDERERKHRILIGLGDNLEEKFRKDVEYMLSFGYHEVSHSLYTTRDPEPLNKRLKEEGIPFPLYNLFEDARVEHLFRKKFGRPFRWMKWEEEEMDDKLVRWLSYYLDYPERIAEWKETGVLNNVSQQADPTQMFLLIIQAEGTALFLRNAYMREDNTVEVVTERGVYGVKKTLQEDNPDLEKRKNLINDLIARIKDYYNRAIKVETEEEMIELLKEWCEEFPQARAGSGNWIPQLIPPGTKDGSEAVELSFADPDEMTDEEFEQLWNDATNGSDDGNNNRDDRNDEGQPGGLGEKGDREYTRGEGSPIIELSPYREPVDWDRVKRDVERLIKSFRSVTARRDTITPSKRLSTRKLAMDRDDMYRREEEISFRMRPFTVIIDCSASMHQMVPEQHHLAAIFSELARKTRTQACLILTRNRSQELFSLPVSLEVVERIPYNGGSENILGGLTEFEGYILKTDFIFIVSDMQITDYWKATEKKIRELRRKGKEVIGIYKGRYYRVARNNAPKFFERYVVTETTNPVDLLIPILKAIVVKG